MEQSTPPQLAHGAWFTTTHWSVVLQSKDPHSLEAEHALEKLCQTYWGPVNNYIRHRGHSPADADDLTQQFFARFVQKKHYQLAEPQRGRFRTFLLTTVKNFLVNEWERASAQKRGGGQLSVSLDEKETQTGRPKIELADERTAEHVYEYKWVLTLLSRLRDRLEAEYSADGKRERFLQMERFLPGAASDMTYAEAGARLGIAEGTVKSDVHRLKLRYREVLREEIAHTVSNPGEIDDELRYLIAVLARPS